MRESPIVLSLDNVSLSYEGSAPVVRSATLSIRQGACFGLIGVNGSGKTTIIKSILALRPVQSGAINILGEPPGRLSIKEHIGYLPERFEPPWFLTGLEFLEFSLRLYNQKPDRGHIVKMADRVGLTEIALKKRVHKYSKGMRQKLGLLGTLLPETRFLILDEPMSGLDPLSRRHVKDLILEEHQKNKTILLSSHILADMDELCDGVTVLHNGGLQFTGTPGQMKARIGGKKGVTMEDAFLHLIEAT